MKSVLLGALLIAAPIFAQDPKPGVREPAWFDLSETRERIAAVMGPPRMVADFGPDLISWQYQIGVEDNHDYSHQFLFRRSTGQLVSVTRTYEPERNLDALFPPTQTKTYSYKVSEAQTFSARLRRLTGGKLLIAMGAAKPGDTTEQLILIRESELKHFLPWISEQMH